MIGWRMAGTNKCEKPYCQQTTIFYSNRNDKPILIIKLGSSYDSVQEEL